MTKRERQTWLISGSIFLTLLFAFGAGYASSPEFLLPLLRQFHLTHERVSFIFSAAALAAAMTSPVIGWLLDRVDARILMPIGVALLGLGLLAAGQANSFTEVVLSYVLIGIGSGASTFVPCSFVIANWFGEDRRGMMLGLATAGEELGGSIFAVVTAYAISAYGWRGAYVVIALPLLVFIMPMLILIVRSRPEGAIKQTISESGRALAGYEVGEALKTRAFWMLVLVNLTYVTALGGTFAHLVAYQVGIGYSQKTAAWVLGAWFVFGTVGKPLMGALGDRIGGRYALGLGFIAMAIGEACLIGGRNQWLLWASVVLTGSQMGNGVGLVPMVLAHTLGLKRFGTLYGIVIVGLTLGQFLGPPFVGKIYDLTGSYAVGFESCLVLMLIAAVAGFACSVPRKSKIHSGHLAAAGI